MSIRILSKLKRIADHEGTRRYAANTIWLISEKILRMFVGLLVGIWVARYLGPERFGLLTYSQSFVFLFSAIANLGLDAIVVRELLKNESRRDVVMGSAFGLKLGGAIVIMPLLAFAVSATSNDSYTNLLMFIVASANIFQAFNVIDFYYQSNVSSRYVALASTAALALSSIVKVCLLATEASLTAFAAMAVFDSVVLSAGLVYVYKKASRLSVSTWTFDFKTAKGLLIDSWPLALSGLVVSLYMKIDQVMIKELIDAQAVGQYAAAVRISEAWYFIPVAIANSVFPAIVNAKAIGQELYCSRLQRLYALMVWVAIAIAAPMTFLSTWLVNVLYGEAFREAGGVLMIHVWASVFVFLTVSSGKFLTAENLTKKVFYRNFVGAVVNVFMNILLIPIYGIQGAAFATLLAWVSSGFIYDLFDKDLRLMAVMKTKAFFGKGLFF